MVWKLLAGIEDGVDNGWLLIRADAGSLLNSFFSLFPLRSQDALLCQYCQIMESSRVLLTYQGLN